MVSAWIDPPVPVALPLAEPAPALPVTEPVVVPTPAFDAALRSAPDAFVVAPAMNVRMWQHPATERNVAQLKVDGVTVIDPAEGEMACGEYGPGRLPEPQAIVDFLTKNGFLGAK